MLFSPKKSTYRLFFQNYSQLTCFLAKFWMELMLAAWLGPEPALGGKGILYVSPIFLVKCQL